MACRRGTLRPKVLRWRVCWSCCCVLDHYRRHQLGPNQIGPSNPPNKTRPSQSDPAILTESLRPLLIPAPFAYTRPLRFPIASSPLTHLLQSRLQRAHIPRGHSLRGGCEAMSEGIVSTGNGVSGCLRAVSGHAWIDTGRERKD
jgi:hypothetical protein